MQTAATFQVLLDPCLLSFYGWWQLVVCLFAVAVLMAIWWHIGRRRQDVGQVWLSLGTIPNVIALLLLSGVAREMA